MYDQKQLKDVLNDMFDAAIYGEMVYVEEFLVGEELTISGMPPGVYEINGSILKDYTEQSLIFTNGGPIQSLEKIRDFFDGFLSLFLRVLHLR